MLHMFTATNLKPGVDPADFVFALDRFAGYLRERDLLAACGTVARRHRHPVLDTDGERDHRLFFTMSFRDRGQADAAVAEIRARTRPLLGYHHAVFSKVAEPVFTCFEDGPLPAEP